MNDDGNRNQPHRYRSRPTSGRSWKRRAAASAAIEAAVQCPPASPAPAACSCSEHADAAATFLHRNAPKPMR